MSLLPLLVVSLGVADASALARTGAATEVHLPGARSLWVPAGPFTFGATADELAAALAMCKRELAALDNVDKICVAEALFGGEGPARTVYLPGFYLDRQEVSVGEYRRCVDAGRCDPRPLIESDPRLLDRRLPVTSVSWFDADRYCAFVGGTLPTELQWERAARGTRARIFPWGDAPFDKRSNHGRFHILNAGGPFAAPVVRIDERDGYPLLSPPGAFPDGASPDGFVDMAGNAMEWMRDPVGEEGPVRAPATTAQPLQGGRRMLRGGSFRQPLLYHRVTAWEAAAPDLRSAEVGFRCASERAIERR